MRASLKAELNGVYLANVLGVFQFRLFIGFGNAIDPFVDRAFGFNFDAAQAWDRSFIDRVHHRDQEAIVSGRIGPTHIPRRASWKIAWGRF